MQATTSPAPPHETLPQRAWRSLASAGTGATDAPALRDPRVVQASAFIDLGLRTLAIRILQHLAVSGAAEQTARDLLNQAQELPNDIVSVAERERTMLANTRWLPEDLQPCDEDIHRWRREYGSITWLRAIDGNIVRCNLDNGRVGHLQDAQGIAKKQLDPLLTRMSSRPCRPIVIEGLDPPWIFLALFNVPRSERHHQFRQPLLIVQRDRGELYNGLACTEIGEGLSDERLQWFVGEDATERLRPWLQERIRVSPPQCAIQNPLLRQRSNPTIEQVGKEATENWERLHQNLSEKIHNTLSPRTPEYWGNRFRDASTGGPPLRVVVVVSRYSTYIRHVAEDLCTELNTMGNQATLLMEPDDFSVATDTMYMDAIATINPDLIITINYPRHMMREHVPSDIPFVCWVQDAMPHLFQEEQGRALGPLDFMVGMVHRSLHEQFCYPDSQLRWLPMNASTGKFHRSRGAGDRECDIAWATHHGASVEDLHQRLTRNLIDKHPSISERTAYAFDRIMGVVRSPTCFVHDELAKLCEDSSLEVLRGDEDGSPDPVHLSSYINQIAERAFRIETARWAVSIAKRRGWLLRFHGNGWDTNPEFSAFAAPAVEHGAELAGCYARAGVHLHASLNQTLHQRVAECAFAGGLALCRVPRDVFSLMNDHAIAESEKNGIGTPLPGDARGRCIPIADIEPARRMVSELQRLGLCRPEEYADGFLRWPGFKVRDALKNYTESRQTHTTAFESMTGLFFSSEQTLEQLIDYALTGNEWRAEQIDHTQRALSSSMTTKSFISGVLGFVQERLDAASTSGTPPTG